MTDWKPHLLFQNGGGGGGGGIAPFVTDDLFKK